MSPRPLSERIEVKWRIHRKCSTHFISNLLVSFEKLSNLFYTCKDFLLISALKHLRHLNFKIHSSKGQPRSITHLSTGQNHLSGASGHHLCHTLYMRFSSQWGVQLCEVSSYVRCLVMSGVQLWEVSSYVRSQLCKVSNYVGCQLWKVSGMAGVLLGKESSYESCPVMWGAQLCEVSSNASCPVMWGVQ